MPARPAAAGVGCLGLLAVVFVVAIIYDIAQFVGQQATAVILGAILAFALVAILHRSHFDWRRDISGRSESHSAGIQRLDLQSSQILAIEAARSAPERRLLLAREFGRLASDALALSPSKRVPWSHRRRLEGLGRETELLLASATDTHVGFLRETKPEDPLAAVRIQEAITSLAGYVVLQRQFALSPSLDLEQARVLVRERNRLQMKHNEIVEILHRK